MQVKKLRDTLRNTKVSEIRCESIYFQNGQMIKEYSAIMIKEIRFWDIGLNKYLFLHYINSKNNLCKTILIIDFINEILTNDVSEDKSNYIYDSNGVKAN